MKRSLAHISFASRQSKLGCKTCFMGERGKMRSHLEHGTWWGERLFHGLNTWNGRKRPCFTMERTVRNDVTIVKHCPHFLLADRNFSGKKLDGKIPTPKPGKGTRGGIRNSLVVCCFPPCPHPPLLCGLDSLGFYESSQLGKHAISLAVFPSTRFVAPRSSVERTQQQNENYAKWIHGMEKNKQRESRNKGKSWKSERPEGRPPNSWSRPRFRIESAQ